MPNSSLKAQEPKAQKPDVPKPPEVPALPAVLLGEGNLPDTVGDLRSQINVMAEAVWNKRLIEGKRLALDQLKNWGKASYPQAAITFAKSLAGLLNPNSSSESARITNIAVLEAMAETVPLELRKDEKLLAVVEEMH